MRPTLERTNDIGENLWRVRGFLRHVRATNKDRTLRPPDATTEETAVHAWVDLCIIAGWGPMMPRSERALDETLQHISFQESPIGQYLASVA
jgi:hypothetical protein